MLTLNRFYFDSDKIDISAGSVGSREFTITVMPPPDGGLFVQFEFQSIGKAREFADRVGQMLDALELRLFNVLGEAAIIVLRSEAQPAMSEAEQAKARSMLDAPAEPTEKLRELMQPAERTALERTCAKHNEPLVCLVCDGWVSQRPPAGPQARQEQE